MVARDDERTALRGFASLKPRPPRSGHASTEAVRLQVLGSLAALALVIGLIGVGRANAPQEVAAPPNAPAAVDWNETQGRVLLRYHGKVILEATVVAQDPEGRGLADVAVKLEPTATRDEKDKVEQRLTFAPVQAPEGTQVLLRGAVTGSEEAFPAETLSEAQQRFTYVRNSVGLSRNLRNNAVYDRRWDWVLTGPADGQTRIVPTRRPDGSVEFAWQSRAPRVVLVFCPRFYQKHKDLKYFEPWTYRVWQGSLTGYCTWWAYRGGFTQEVLDAMLAVFVEKHLPDFGYQYMQFDNCYQVGNGSCPQNWLNWNQHKYPGGWQYAIKAIRTAGMRPGIWVHRVHRPSDPHVRDIGEQHPDWFVQRPDGSLFMSRGFYVLNTTNKEAVENMVRVLYRALKQQGWEYVKIDGTGDLLNAYRHPDCAEFFKTHPTTPEESLRAWDIVAREELGRDVYVLACHTVGNARNVIGLVDGARLSNDGFQPRTLADFNYLEGVVWRNDPDHCDVLGLWLMDEDAMMRVFGVENPVPARTIVRPALCAMAGGVLMVSDKVEVYQDDRNIEGMKRSAPVLFTVPGQLYGCGRRPMPWWLQEIDRPFDHWSVLARVQWGEERREPTRSWEFQGMPAEEVAFADLGLDGEEEYLVFEYWSQQFLGKFKGSFTAPAMDENTGIQVFAIRRAREHPWVVSTSRHISQGGVDLVDLKWNAGDKALSGSSRVVVGDPYVLTIHVPEGFKLTRAEVAGRQVRTQAQRGTVAVRFTLAATGTVGWKLNFTGPAGE